MVDEKSWLEGRVDRLFDHFEGGELGSERIGGWFGYSEVPVAFPGYRQEHRSPHEGSRWLSRSKRKRASAAKRRECLQAGSRYSATSASQTLAIVRTRPIADVQSAAFALRFSNG